MDGYTLYAGGEEGNMFDDSLADEEADDDFFDFFGGIYSGELNMKVRFSGGTAFQRSHQVRSVEVIDFDTALYFFEFERDVAEDQSAFLIGAVEVYFIILSGFESSGREMKGHFSIIFTGNSFEPCEHGNLDQFSVFFTEKDRTQRCGRLSGRHEIQLQGSACIVFSAETENSGNIIFTVDHDGFAGGHRGSPEKRRF